MDPYAVLGVSRSASREEIARAYRRLAKQHHPDAGATPSTSMARFNEAWHMLSDPARRARWDRDHAIFESPSWSPAQADRYQRPPPRPHAPSSRMDSGLLTIGVIASVAVLIAVVMIGVSVASPDTPAFGPTFSTAHLSFEYPPGWSVVAGESDQPREHRVVAHLVTFDIQPAQRCTRFADPCDLSTEAMPPGQASIVITAWEGGMPPVPDPVVARPFGLSADRFIGGEPASFELRRSSGGAVAWWQLSPPGFPDRWIEVRADISGRSLDQDALLNQVEALLATVEFEE
ncbi:MAG: DnaJ domain-containing protein [Chloroflexi bacterium]|nr:DnaJ domain-containing protein [Chloroflexota bacterium]